jgi:hypothetical protein
VSNQADDDAWMGVNEAGFAILNAASDDLERETRMNGDFMAHSLAHFTSIPDFEAFLNTPGVEHRFAIGNFGVLDASGTVAMYEVQDTLWWRYNPGADGFIIRTNFSMHGGGNAGVDRYNRSRALLSGYVAGDSLTAETMLVHHARDFSNVYGSTIDLPYAGFWGDELGYGYLSTQYSICRNSNASAVVIEGIKPGESPLLTTMWTLLGQPACTVAVPVWPVGPVPAIASGIVTTPLCDEANRLRGLLFDDPGNQYALDSYRLRGEGSPEWMDVMLNAESEIRTETLNQLEQWRATGPDSTAMVDLERSLCSDAYQLLYNWRPETLFVPRFTVTPRTGPAPLTVHFENRTLHCPDAPAWQFILDGTADATTNQADYTYNDPGLYSVSLKVSRSGLVRTVTEYNFIVATIPEPEPDPTPVWHVTNPSRRSFHVVADFPVGGKVQIDLFDIRGRRLTTLASEQAEAGRHEWIWYEPQEGMRLSNGVYLLRCALGGDEQVVKVVFLR